MDPYRSSILSPEEEVAFLRRLLAVAEARLSTNTGGASSAPFAVATGEIATLLIDWQTFYADLFGLELDISSLCIPERQEGFSRLLVMPQGMTASRLYEACSKLFHCWRYTENLDAITSDRDPAKLGTYAIWIRDRVEADEELKNQSAKMLAQAGIKGMTLSERLAFELKYFKETGKHLDVKNITLCSGSRYPFGVVPCVDWHAGRGGMRVSWYGHVDRDDDLRARAAVFL